MIILVIKCQNKRECAWITQCLNMVDFLLRILSSFRQKNREKATINSHTIWQNREDQHFSTIWQAFFPRYIFDKVTSKQISK